MTARRRIESGRLRQLTAAILAVSAFAAPALAQADDDALRTFQQRLQTYLALRTSLSNTLDPLTPTADAVELASRQTALAVALRAARAKAAPGDLIPPAIADLIRTVVLDDFKRRTAAAERAVFSEIPNAPRPTINRTYPADAALPTVPPLLLAKLPRLPDNLQYRFYGRHVVILDGDVHIIVDYVSNVLPPA